MLSKARYKYEFIFDDKPTFLFKKNYQLINRRKKVIFSAFLDEFSDICYNMGY